MPGSLRGKGAEAITVTSPLAGKATDTADKGPHAQTQHRVGVRSAVDAGQDTLFLSTEAPTGPTPSRPPIRGFTRYDCLELLGEGGMGSVYKALDPRLNRHVALKFIRGNDPSWIQRFSWEAQAQARIDHPNVCKVYEVGEEAGLPFIAMQYIEGEPLNRAAERMTLEQRVKVVIDVAEGLHAAHKLGLIHRDVKPANILVERTAEGAFRPYLVDFGLAREVAADGKTIINVEGTPAYMAPEQVTGVLRQLDRRTDVYCLGATMYEIFTGRPPFTDESLLDMIYKVVNEPPRALRSVDKAIPVDVETIVMKCLEKEASQRYDSAKGLASDLARYLEGEPIQARRASFVYYAVKRAKKNKLAVGAVSAALLFLVCLGVVVLRAKLQAAYQAKMASRVGVLAEGFGQDVKEMELFMRYVYALPIHDVSREKQVIRTRMAKIASKIQVTREMLGGLVEGPGDYALGRGHLALEEPEQALDRLEQALGSGYATPEVMFAIGEAHGMLYRKGLDRAQRLADSAARAAYERQVEQQHLAPAIRYLRESARAGGESSHYVSGLIALYEKRFDEALKEAALASEATPWTYEATKLEGDIHFVKGEVARAEGKVAESRGEFSAARDAYQRAAEMGTSDPSVHEALASAWSEIMILDGESGSDTQQVFLRVVESCDNAIRIEPHVGSPYAKKAWAYVRRGEQEISGEGDPRPYFSKAIEAGKRAIALDDADATAHNSLGASYYLTAFYETDLGVDVSPSLRSAIESMERSIALDPNSAWGWNDIGTAYGLLAEYNASHGADPSSLFDRSAAYLERAAELQPNEINPLLNQGWFYAKRASFELDRGRSPDAPLERALDALEAALRLRADNPMIHDNLGLAYLMDGRRERLSGGDPEIPLARAQQSYATALRLNPDDVEALVGAGVVDNEGALWRIDRGADPTEVLGHGRALVRRALALKRDNAQAQGALGQIELTAARWAALRWEDPERLFASAEEALRRALALNGGSAQLSGTLAALHRHRAAWAAQTGRNASADIDAGLGMITRALAIDPATPWLTATRGALHLAKAELARSPEERTEAARLAVASLEGALRNNAFLTREYGPLLAEAQRLRGR